MGDLFDNVLNLEEQHYKEGYKEGVLDGKRAGYLEGRHYGLQTGFQRFMSIGIMQGRLDVWKNTISNSDQADSDRAARNAKHIAQLESVLDPETLPMTNEDEDVDEFEKRLKRAKAKAKVVATIAKDTSTIRIYDDTIPLKNTEEVIEDM